MVYNAGFSFLPVYLGCAASKKLGASEVPGMMLAGIPIESSFVEMANDGITSLSVFGLPASDVNYSQSPMPILLSEWVMSRIERRDRRHRHGFLLARPAQGRPGRRAEDRHGPHA
jgi:PTS system beta-glucosides-specific IIC component